MMGDLMPYGGNQDSGVPWLGDIPAHWQQFPGRACFVEGKTPNVGMQETTVLSLSYGQIVIKPPEKLHGLVPASFETYQIIEPYDIVVRPTDLQNDWVSLRTGLAKTRGIITSAYMRLRTKDSITPQYGHLLLHAYDLKKVFYGLGSGLRQNLSWRDFKYLPCLVPPPDDQAAIVRYLAYIDRRIQRYIRAKEKLIALLEEQKQALIHHAVTRGLNPDIPLKPSGIEWLGEIPEDWTLKRFKFVAQIKHGQIDPRLCPYRDFVLVAPNHIESGTGRLIQEETARAQGAVSGKYVVRPGQIVYSKIRPNLRKATIAQHNCLCSADMYPITPRDDELLPEFLLLLMLPRRSHDTQLISQCVLRCPK